MRCGMGAPPLGSTATFSQAWLLQGEGGEQVTGERTAVAILRPCTQLPPRL